MRAQQVLQLGAIHFRVTLEEGFQNVVVLVPLHHLVVPLQEHENRGACQHVQGHHDGEKGKSGVVLAEMDQATTASRCHGDANDDGDDDDDVSDNTSSGVTPTLPSPFRHGHKYLVYDPGRRQLLQGIYMVSTKPDEIFDTNSPMLKKHPLREVPC